MPQSPADLLAPGRPLTLASVADGAQGLIVADLAHAVRRGEIQALEDQEVAVGEGRGRIGDEFDAAHRGSGIIAYPREARMARAISANPSPISARAT